MGNDLAEMIEQLEKELLQPEVRRSPDKLDRLLADDFLEFGASGKSYTKQDVLRLLPQSDGTEYQATGFEARQIGSDVVLLTYRTAVRDRHTGRTTWTLRSSLWRRRDDGWQLVFHQGTPEAGKT
jgi:hypothetical protein